MSDEYSMMREQRDAALARVSTYEDNVARLKEEIRNVQGAFCAKKRADGTYSYDRMEWVKKIGPEEALVVRKVIDETYNVSGAPGEKPRVRLSA